MANRSARQVAAIALREWRARNDFAESILGRHLDSSGLSEQDRSFVTELFYGVLRNVMLLDFWITSLRSTHLDGNTRDLLRLGIYQLLLLGTPEYAAVNETVSVATKRTRSVVNAVLRNAARKKDHLLDTANNQPLSVRESHPQFLVNRWSQRFGPAETARLCRWNNLPAPIYARINRLRISQEVFLSKYSDAERLTRPDDFVRLPFVLTEAMFNGHCYIQDPSTAAACTLLDPQPGDSILDACAAPGGKTGYVAQLMQNRGSIVACDRDSARMETLRANLSRLGVTIAQFVQNDWASCKKPPGAVQSALFDRILIDAPCSNTGVMRRRVDLRWRLTPSDFERMPELQLGILRATIPLLKPTGCLVYSTCSIELEENETVINRALSEFPFMTLEETVSQLPFRDGFDGAYTAKLIRIA